MKSGEKSAETLEERLRERAEAAGIAIAPERLRDILDGAGRLEEGMARVRAFLASPEAAGRS